VTILVEHGNHGRSCVTVQGVDTVDVPSLGAASGRGTCACDCPEPVGLQRQCPVGYTRPDGHTTWPLEQCGFTELLPV